MAMDPDAQILLNNAAEALKHAQSDQNRGEYWTKMAMEWTRIAETHTHGGTDYCKECPDDMPWPCCVVLKAQRVSKDILKWAHWDAA
jgi:hypothetical protein